MYSHNLKRLTYLRSIFRFSSTVVRKASPSTVKLTDNNEKFVIGEKYHGFQVVDIQPVPEFALEAIHLRHDKTNAEYLHLKRNDNNNVFSINFRTTPMDNSGKPHILEHTVLCGSHKYPVRDPFFKMLNRSLATFMNAMTAPDYTMYPFSTTNPTDFRNLQSIYLDAVFRPLLSKSDFMQEGWRLEHTDLSNPLSPLAIKGVVYNEMRGALAETERVVGEKLMNHILPDHTYGVIAGGNPLDIPSMTWQDLKDFHRHYYHPSNCMFFSYGNFPVLPTLKYLQEEYLQGYQKINVTKVPGQKRWERPKSIQIEGRYNEMGPPKQNTILIGYLMNDVQDAYGSFVMQFITDLLTKGVNAPFYKSLIEPNFSNGFSSSTGYEPHIRDTLFVLGLQGVDETDFNKFLQIFENTIHDVVKNGFAKDEIERVLHSYELSIKHETSNFGLRLLFNLVPLWNHDAGMVDSLKVNKYLEKLKQDLKTNPTFLQDVVKARFVLNSHKLVMTMIPDRNYDQKLTEKENDLLASLVSNLDAIKNKDIFLEGNRLRDEQNRPQPVDLLPMLKENDIAEKLPTTKLTLTETQNVPLQLCDVNTNGITYLRMIFGVSHLQDYDHKMLLPLFNYVVSKLGTKNYNYRDFDQLIGRKTGGLSFSNHISENIRNIDEYEQGIAMTSHALDRNLDDMFSIWNEIFNIEKLENVERLKTLLNIYVSDLTNGIIDSGHLYAISSANGLISGVGHERYMLAGFGHLQYMKQIQNTDVHQIIDKLTAMARLIFNKRDLRIAVNTEAASGKLLSKIEKFVANIPGAPSKQLNYAKFKTMDVPNADELVCRHHMLNVPVYFASKAIKTVPFADAKYAPLQILSRYLTAKYLFPIIREKNGAYGCGVRLNKSGLFSFFSYRDPSNFSTLDVFDGALNFMRKQKISDEAVLESKLNIFQVVDAPVTPDSRGDDLFYTHITDQMLQEYRERLLAVTKQDLLNVAEEVLAADSKYQVGKALLGPEVQNMNSFVKQNERWTIESTET